MSLHPQFITKSQVEQVLSRYSNTLSSLPKSTTPPLTSLDATRAGTIPSAIRSRNPPHLTKPELQTILKCKLARGKYRPGLEKFAEALDPAAVEAASEKAFASLGSSQPPSVEQVVKSLAPLTALKGIGPATASYLLAAYSPEHVAPFSDEAYRWVCWGEGKGGWDMKIKYDVKEYRLFTGKVEELRKRLGVGANQIEQVGWVLGKEKAILEDASSETTAEAGNIDNSEQAGVQSKPEDKGTKRSAEDDGQEEGEKANAKKEKIAAPPTRRSKRLAKTEP